MASLKKLVIPDSGALIDGGATPELMGVLGSVEQFTSSAKALLDGNTYRLEPVLIEYPENKDYQLFRNAPWAFTVKTITTKCVTGSCTVTTKINTTAVGGTANAASTSEDIKTPPDTNTGAIGDDLLITVSSNSSCELLSITVLLEIPLVP